jgi:hypothetical protein
LTSPKFGSSPGVSRWILHLNPPFGLSLPELLRDAVVPAFR